jgi:hypothetical protein
MPELVSTSLAVTLYRLYLHGDSWGLKLSRHGGKSAIFELYRYRYSLFIFYVNIQTRLYLWAKSHLCWLHRRLLFILCDSLQAVFRKAKSYQFRFQ